MIGAIQPDGKKSASLVSWAVHTPRPFASISLYTSPLKEFAQKPIVETGDIIKVGLKVAEPVHAEGVPLYSGVEGKVTAVNLEDDSDTEVYCIRIEADLKARAKTQAFVNTLVDDDGWQTLEPIEILNNMREAGVLFSGEPEEPLHHKIYQSPKPYRSTLVINACESEPYVTSDHSLIMSKPLEVLKGAELLRKACSADRVVIAITDDKEEVIELLKSRIYFFKWSHFSVQVFPALYPQGHETVLMKSLFQELIDENAEDVKDLSSIMNAATAFAVYEGVVLGKPYYEKAVTVGGECVVDAQNVWLPLGVTVEDAFKSCRGLLRDPRKVILGGPLRGKAQRDLRGKISSSTTAVLALSKEACPPVQIEPCVRCGDCIQVCPVGLSPALISSAVENNEIRAARQWNASACIECGNCNYVCPSKRPLEELIRFAGAHDFFNDLVEGRDF